MSGRLPGVLNLSDSAARYTTIGKQLCGLTNPSIFWEDYTKITTTVSTTAAPVGWEITNRTNGTANPRNTLSGGVYLLDSTATANSSIDIVSCATVLRNTKTQAWYWASEWAIPAAVDGVAWVMNILEELVAGNVIGAGVRGVGGFTNFHMMYNLLSGVAYLDYGVAVDTARHITEIWSIGTDNKLYTRMDAGAIQSVTNADGTNQNVYLRKNCRNGATAAARQIAPRWDLILSPQE